MLIRLPIEMLRSLALFTLFSLLVLMLTRISVLIGLLDYQSYSVSQLTSLVYMGLRFDLKIISVFSLAFYLLPLSILLLIYKQQSGILRLFDSVLFWTFILEVFICLVGYGYYSHFGTPIDQLMFGLWEDGFKEVVLSMAVNPLVIYLTLALIVWIMVCYSLFSRYRNPMTKVFYKRLMVLINFIFFFFILLLLARGSLGSLPLSKKINQGNQDPQLNGLALNPIMDLYNAYRDNQKDIIDFSSKKLLSELKLDSFEQLKTLAGYSKDYPLVQLSTKKTTPEPNVIFVLMEGWSSHIAMGQSQDNNVLGEFNQHKHNDYFLTKFVSNSYGTNPSLGRILMNSPFGHITSSKGKNISYDVSNILPFKKAGYYTQFISGGNREWRNTGNFYSKQGFDDFYDRTHIRGYTKNTSANPWGAYEEDLFSFVKHRLISNQDKTSFSFVLTTNNHPPVVLPDNFESPSYDYSRYQMEESDYLKEMLNAYYYSSNELGKFLTWLKSSEFAGNTIVVATGDHILKGFDNYNAKHKLFAKYSVPFYAYIPPQYQQFPKTNITGSHIDIFPTLYDLSLSEASFYAFGNSLLRKTPETSYAWYKDSLGLFSNGVTSNDKRYEWDDSNLLLNTEPKDMSQFQKQIMKQVYYQGNLAKFLLFKNYEEKR